MKGHELVIISLHDAQAVCSCGNWSMVCTGERTEKYLQEEFNKHHSTETGAKIHYGKLVNGYEIKYNHLWKKWQVSHENIGACIAEFDFLNDAIEYSVKG